MAIRYKKLNNMTHKYDVIYMFVNEGIHKKAKQGPFQVDTFKVEIDEIFHNYE